jgi:hypothetical protein
MHDFLKSMQKSYQVSSGYVVRQIADDFLLIPVKMQEKGESQLAIMNETGKFLWEQLQEGRTMEELIRAMTEAYQVSEKDAVADIIDFLNNLKERKLLQESRGE